MVRRNLVFGIIFILVSLIILEMYGPLYLVHNNKSALDFVEKNIVVEFENYTEYYTGIKLPIWYREEPRVEVLISSESKNIIPDKLKALLRNVKQEYQQEKYTIDNLELYTLKFEIYLRKSGIKDWIVLENRN